MTDFTIAATMTIVILAFLCGVISGIIGTIWAIWFWLRRMVDEILNNTEIKVKK